MEINSADRTISHSAYIRTKLKQNLPDWYNQSHEDLEIQQLNSLTNFVYKIESK